MHEASAAEALVKMLCAILAQRPRTGAEAKVTLVRLAVGESKGYMEESLDFYFKAFSKGTPLEGAELETKFEKATFRCASCGSVYERKRFSFDCPSCGLPGALESEGSSLYVESIEVEENA